MKSGAGSNPAALILFMTTEETQNLLKSPHYISGLRQPLEQVADILDAQNKKEYAEALRFAAIVCILYADVVGEKLYKYN